MTKQIHHSWLRIGKLTSEILNFLFGIEKFCYKKHYIDVIRFFFIYNHYREKVFEDMNLQLRTLDAAEVIASNEENGIENGISEQCLHNAIKILKQKRQNQLNVSFGRTF